MAIGYKTFRIWKKLYMINASTLEEKYNKKTWVLTQNRPFKIIFVFVCVSLFRDNKALP